ncbi:hypothetical protein BGZ58_003839 [Dissophora ornata]|nr:hypothetical protein BGZ58_003839 [Dissophora ornata]
MNTLTQVVDEYYEMMVRLRAITGQETPSTTDVIKDEPGIEDEPEIMDEPQIEDEPEIMYSHYYMVKYLSGMRHLFDNPKEEGNKEKSIEKEDRWQHEVSEYDDVIPSSVQRDKCLVDWTWVSEKLHRRLSIDRLLHSSTSMSSPSSSIDLYTPEMCRQLWRIYFYTKLDICGAYDPLYEVKGKLTKLHFLQVKNQPKGRVTRDTAVQFTVSEISAAVGLTSSLTLLRRENEERFRRFGIWNEDEYGLLRKGMAAYRCLLENLEELRRVSRLDQQLDVVMGRPLDPYNDDAEDDFSGTYSLAAEMTAVWTKTWWPNSKEDVEEFRSRLGRRADDEYDWDWIRVRYVPWRRLNEIKLQVFMMRFGSQVN